MFAFAFAAADILCTIPPDQCFEYCGGGGGDFCGGVELGSVGVCLCFAPGNIHIAYGYAQFQLPHIAFAQLAGMGGLGSKITACHELSGLDLGQPQVQLAKQAGDNFLCNSSAGNRVAADAHKRALLYRQRIYTGFSGKSRSVFRAEY